MCNCTNKPSFLKKIKEAYELSTTGDQHVVFGGKNANSDVLWVEKEEYAKNDINVCCYFIPLSEKEFKEVIKTNKKKLKKQ